MPFVNDDTKLLEEVDAVLNERSKAGIDGLVGGLEAVVVNVEPGHLQSAVGWFLRYTGYAFQGAYEDQEFATCVLRLEGSADFLFRSRKQGENPFLPFNDRPKSGHMPNARLETFIYSCADLETYVARQKESGLGFLTGDILDKGGYSFIQTAPSRFTGNSLGFIQWKGGRGEYGAGGGTALDWTFDKPNKPYLKNIRELDHSATRVRAEDRDAAILEFMRYTNYTFAFAVHVESLNSITNVARLGPDDYAQVFTSGISPFKTLETSGPTERYIHNYGLRVHHIAFNTDDVENVFASLKGDGMGFIVELVGSREEGLKQTFTDMSPDTFLVNEYIHRYDGFDGFFTKSNVTMLTKATEKH